jgi:hypothetical protein
MAGAVAVVLAASMAAAGTPGRADAPRLLKDAVRTGTIEDAAFAAITDWILHEKEEAVAAGLIEVLGSVDPSAPRIAGSARYDETAAAVLSIFTRVLRDAQSNRRPDALEAELSALVGIAAPAIAASLRETPAADQARLISAFGMLGPVADDLVPLLAEGLRHPQREVRIGAVTALAALGRSAGAALPALRAAAGDPDPDVRAAAKEALKKIR